MQRIPTTRLFALVAGLAIGCGGPSAPLGPDPEGAETCVRVKVWDSYSEGWALRSLTKHTLSPGETAPLATTLYAGNEYTFTGCGDAGVGHLDVLLYDANQQLVTRDAAKDREPVLTFTPPTTATYYAVLYLRGRKDGAAAPAGAALAITYK